MEAKLICDVKDLLIFYGMLLARESLWVSLAFICLELKLLNGAPCE